MADYEVNRRLKKLIIEVYKTTPFNFSKRYNDVQGVKTNAIMRERNGVSNKMLDTICEAYPEINKSCLLTGEGPMLKNSPNNIVQTIGNNSSNNTQSASDCELWKRLYEEKKQHIDILNQLLAERDRLLDEKDKRIATLEQLVAVLQSKNI